MTKFVLYCNKEHIIGYEVSGHSTINVDDINGKLVCSAVSSAVIMTANSLTDVLMHSCNVDVKDGYLKVLVNSPNEETDLLIKSLDFHINELKNEFPDKIKVIMEEENHD